MTDKIDWLKVIFRQPDHETIELTIGELRTLIAQYRDAKLALDIERKVKIDTPPPSLPVEMPKTKAATKHMAQEIIKNHEGNPLALSKKDSELKEYTIYCEKCGTEETYIETTYLHHTMCIKCRAAQYNIKKSPRGDYSIECIDCHRPVEIKSHPGTKKRRCPDCQAAKTYKKKERKGKNSLPVDPDDPEGWLGDS